MTTAVEAARHMDGILAGHDSGLSWKEDSLWNENGFCHKIVTWDQYYVVGFF